MYVLVFKPGKLLKERVAQNLPVSSAPSDLAQDKL